MTAPTPHDATVSDAPLVFLPPRRRRRLLPFVIIATLVAVGVAAALIVPVVAGGVAPTSADEERTMRLTEGNLRADIELPAGWSWSPSFGDDSRGVAGSPDRVMTVELSLTAGTDPRKALEDAAPGPLGPISEETLSEDSAGSRTLLYARVPDQGVVVGALTTGSAVVTFVASSSPTYDVELARLLAAIEVTP
jgi:hypothetical protein